MHEVLDNRLGGLSLPRKSVVRLTDRPNMTLDVYRGRKTTMQQQQQHLVLTNHPEDADGKHHNHSDYIYCISPLSQVFCDCSFPRVLSFQQIHHHSSLFL